MSHSTLAPGPEERVVQQARQAVAARRVAAIQRPAPLAGWFLAHWLAVVNVGTALVVAGTAAAPWLRAHDWTGAAAALYGFYRLQCPQWPDHSFFLFGEPMGMEQRMVAIYGGTLVAASVFAVLRGWLPALPLGAFVAASLPMAIDLGTQMAGLRDGTGAWRVLTGALFALAAAWWALPRLDLATRSAAVSATARRRGSGPPAIRPSRRRMSRPWERSPNRPAPSRDRSDCRRRVGHGRSLGRGGGFRLPGPRGVDPERLQLGLGGQQLVLELRDALLGCPGRTDRACIGAAAHPAHPEDAEDHHQRAGQQDQERQGGHE